MVVFQRTILKELNSWLQSPHRKPLILRGARQVGKTTIVKLFARSFKQFLYFNLEKKEDRDVFEQDISFEKLVKAIFFLREKDPYEASTLIFIDEIQNSSRAISALRFFYEDVPHIPVIAAGSLFELYLEKFQNSFPVGRVEFRYLYPMSFIEFLNAAGKNTIVESILNPPLPEYADTPARELFHEYVLIGGMPEIVAEFLDKKNVHKLTVIYESLMVSYIDDAAKYAKNNTMFQVLRHAIESAPMEAGKRIKFQGFGNSNYRSREMGEALRNIVRAMLVYLLYPVTSTEVPLVPDKRKSPKLQFLDTGLVNYQAGLQEQFFSLKDLNSLYQGKIAEHIVAQEFIARNNRKNNPPLFWVRNKPGSSAETDFLYQYKGTVIPVEVKSGKTGTLRSLHQFMAQSDSPIAVRLYAGLTRTDVISLAKGGKYTLLNLPYYLGGFLDIYLDWALGSAGQLSLTTPPGYRTSGCSYPK